MFFKRLLEEHLLHQSVVQQRQPVQQSSINVQHGIRVAFLEHQSVPCCITTNKHCERLSIVSIEEQQPYGRPLEWKAKLTRHICKTISTRQETSVNELTLTQ